MDNSKVRSYRDVIVTTNTTARKANKAEPERTELGRNEMRHGAQLAMTVGWRYGIGTLKIIVNQGYNNISREVDGPCGLVRSYALS